MVILVILLAVIFVCFLGWMLSLNDRISALEAKDRLGAEAYIRKLQEDSKNSG